MNLVKYNLVLLLLIILLLINHINIIIKTSFEKRDYMNDINE